MNVKSTTTVYLCQDVNFGVFKNVLKTSSRWKTVHQVWVTTAFKMVLLAQYANCNRVWFSLLGAVFGKA